VSGAAKMTVKGSSALKKHLKGERLTQRNAIEAKCCDCVGNYLDGREDCGVIECPLHPWMPYRKGRVRPKKSRKPRTNTPRNGRTRPQKSGKPRASTLQNKDVKRTGGVKRTKKKKPKIPLT
jgi:hypothetical protein